MTRTTRLSSERDPVREDANPGILPDVAYFAYGEYYMHIFHIWHIIHIWHFLLTLVDSTTKVSAVSQLPDAEDSGLPSGSAKKLHRDRKSNLDGFLLTKITTVCIDSATDYSVKFIKPLCHRLPLTQRPESTIRVLCRYGCYICLFLLSM